ncbi:hypothetical protein PoB_001849700 [Plakobranchus ocellatus]|uniref:Uncharacterized protein n=1 Tax=Plakobranchus ocellatus TaxID=259542 RepID=A0AAV3ZBX0_9GAST|nr:hypothetical protein PoB_001849700 [Plakobranchus ocellatus]
MRSRKRGSGWRRKKRFRESQGGRGEVGDMADNDRLSSNALLMISMSPPPGQGTVDGDRNSDRKVPADLRADSLAILPPTPQMRRRRRRGGGGGGAIQHVSVQHTRLFTLLPVLRLHSHAR